jgi:hypothetical protein
VLGLAATHLDMRQPGMNTLGLEYRQSSLRSLKEEIARGAELSLTELDALLATCLALTAQISYVKDGFCEFIVSLRSCGLVTATIFAKETASQSIFWTRGDEHMEEMASRFAGDARLDHRIRQAAAQSLKAVGSLCSCTTHSVFYQLLLDTVTAPHPWQGYVNFTKIYAALTTMTPSNIDQLTSTTDPVAQLLQVHFLAIQAVLTPFTVAEAGEHAAFVPVLPLSVWVEDIACKLGDEWLELAQWPLRVIAATKVLAEQDWLSFQTLARQVSTVPEPFS